MKPGYIYRIKWQAFSDPDPVTGDPLYDIQCVVDISDNDNLIDDADDPVLTELQGSGTPGRLSVIDNAEDPFTVILGQQLTLEFESTPSAGMATFASGNDNRWIVHYYNGGGTLFKGFLVMDDISEPILPDPNTVTLTATDGLGLLKDIQLVNASDVNPTNEQKVSSFLAWALRLTGLSLEMRVAFNIKLVGMNSDLRIPNADAEHLFDNIFLDAKSAEDEISTCVNAYEVIQKILGEEARLFQYAGQWWIVRVDEIEHPTRGLYITSFDATGAFIANLGEITFVKQIGILKTIKLSMERSRATVNRPKKFVRLNYNYDLPREIPCNVDFVRGDEASSTPPYKFYALDCWTKRRGVPGGYNTLITITDQIRREFNGNDYEINRFVIITPQTGHSGFSSTDDEYIESEPIYIDIKDKFTGSIDWRLPANLSTSSQQFRMFRFVLHGDDGSWWILGEATVGDGIPVWYNTSGWTVNTGKGATGIVFSAQDETEWQNISWEAPPAPVAGNLYIWLNQFYQSVTTGVNTSIYYSNLNFEYLAYINGSYRKYSGQYHKTQQAGTFKAKRETTVYMSDSPKRLFKWAMQIYNGSAYELAGNFYNAAAFPDGGYPDATYEHPFGQIQLFDVWNQVKNEMRIVQGVMQGLELGKIVGIDIIPPAHLINKWSLTDPSPDLENRFFLLLHFDQDHDAQEWQGVFREVFNTTKEKDYTNHEFKYIEQR